MQPLSIWSLLDHSHSSLYFFLLSFFLIFFGPSCVQISIFFKDPGYLLVNEWYAHAENLDQVGELLKRIAKQRKEGVTGATVVSSWLRRQIQPLQCRNHLGFKYTGLYDPSQFSSEKTSRDEAMVLLYNLFEGATSLPELLDLFRASNPPKQVWFSVIEWFSELSFCALANSVFCRMIC